MNQPRVLLLQLSERTSAKGNRYMAGWLGKASVVAFRGEDDKHGNPTWDVFVSTPEQRPDQQQPRADQRALPLDRHPAGGSDGRVSTSATAANRSASSVARGDGWRGSQYRRPVSGARRGPADGGELVEDGVDDLYR